MSRLRCRPGEPRPLSARYGRCASGRMAVEQNARAANLTRVKVGRWKGSRCWARKANTGGTMAVMWAPCRCDRRHSPGRAAAEEVAKGSHEIERYEDNRARPDGDVRRRMPARVHPHRHQHQGRDQPGRRRRSNPKLAGLKVNREYVGLTTALVDVTDNSSDNCSVFAYGRCVRKTVKIRDRSGPPVSPFSSG